MNRSVTKHFWQWFQRNNKSYLQLNSLSEEEMVYWMNESVAQIRSYDSNLYVDFFLPENGASPQIIITASGNAEYFERVSALVSNAPHIPGWEIIGLHPPRPIDFGIQEVWGYTGIDPHNLWVIPCLTPIDEDSGICVFAEHCEASNDGFEGAVWAVLWNLLGERSVTLDIGWVEVGRLGELPVDERTELIKLQELPAYLERSKFSSVYINGQGEMEEGSR